MTEKNQLQLTSIYAFSEQTADSKQQLLTIPKCQKVSDDYISIFYHGLLIFYICFKYNTVSKSKKVQFFETQNSLPQRIKSTFLGRKKTSLLSIEQPKAPWWSRKKNPKNVFFSLWGKPAIIRLHIVTERVPETRASGTRCTVEKWVEGKLYKAKFLPYFMIFQCGVLRRCYGTLINHQICQKIEKMKKSLVWLA